MLHGKNTVRRSYKLQMPRMTWTSAQFQRIIRNEPKKRQSYEACCWRLLWNANAIICFVNNLRNAEKQKCLLRSLCTWCVCAKQRINVFLLLIFIVGSVLFLVKNVLWHVTQNTLTLGRDGGKFNASMPMQWANFAYDLPWMQMKCEPI